MLPNILFFTCHDLGKHLSVYGQRTVVSPSLEALSAGGVAFDSHFCTAPQCSPSRAALHTGRHAHANGMMGLAHYPFCWRLHPDEQHLARRLADIGYEPILFGAQHLTSTTQVAELGYQTFDPVDPLYPAPDLAERAAQYLHNRRDDPRPFYLEVGFFEPHRPYDWGGATPDDSAGVRPPRYIPDAPAAHREFAALQGAIRRVDDAVGRLLKTLDDLNLADNTWVIFTTDHGLAMPRAKATLYDPGIEVTLIMRWPGRGIVGGRRLPELTSHVDLVPTILDALGLSPPGNLHGRSFWPLLTGGAYQPNDRVFAEKTFHQSYEPMRAVRTRTHKFIVNFEIDSRINVPDDVRQGQIYPLVVSQVTGVRDHFELYDLRADPDETNNLAGHPDLAEVEASLKQSLLDWMQETGDPLLAGPVPSPFRHRVLARLRGEA